MYPFLNRKSFEEKALSPQIELELETNIAWSALYHGVLALGSQFHDKGESSRARGLPWQLFKLALGMMPKLVGPDATLLNVQVWMPVILIIAQFLTIIGHYHYRMSCSICTNRI